MTGSIAESHTLTSTTLRDAIELGGRHVRAVAV
jgi:hypothetical protein